MFSSFVFSLSLSLSLSTICESFGCPCCIRSFLLCFFFFADFDQILFLVRIYSLVDTKLQFISRSRADLFHRKKCYGHHGKCPLQGGCSIFCVIFSQFFCVCGGCCWCDHRILCVSVRRLCNPLRHKEFLFVSTSAGTYRLTTQSE